MRQSVVVLLLAAIVIALHIVSASATTTRTLRLRLQAFRNPDGRLANGHTCTLTSKCSTSFSFALRTTTAAASEPHTVVSTQVLGSNSIDRAQFELTTSSVELPLSTDASMLVIRVLNNAPSGDVESISEWHLPLASAIATATATATADDWVHFDEVNSRLNQQLTFQFQVVARLSSSPLATRRCDLQCRNGGQCVFDEQTGEPMCRCAAHTNNSNSSVHYRGSLCQVRVVPACKEDANACMNGATCLSATTGECLCAPGYAGHRCQTRRPTSQCGSVTCYNGGTCFIDNDNDYACSCHPAFTGSQCESKLAVSTSTQQTTTAAVASAASVIVSLPEHISSSSSSTEKLFLVIVLGVSLPIIAILVVALVLIQCRRRRDSINTQSTAVEAASKCVDDDDMSDKELDMPRKSATTNAQLPPLSKQARVQNVYEPMPWKSHTVTHEHESNRVKQVPVVATISSGSEINIYSDLIEPSTNVAHHSLRPPITYYSTQQQQQHQNIYSTPPTSVYATRQSAIATSTLTSMV